MNGPTREEITAQQETMETRMDGAVGAVSQCMEAEFAKIHADLQRMAGLLIKWIAGTAIAATTVGITVMIFVLNNAVAMATAPPPTLLVIVLLPESFTPPAATPQP